MVPVAGKPILHWQIEWLQGCGVGGFVLAVGHMADQIRAYFGDGDRLGVEIEYVVEEEPLGTAGALRRALEQLAIDEQVYVTNGDVLTNLDPRQMEEGRAKQGLVGGIALVPFPSPYGVVELDGGSLVRSFREKPLLPDHWINSGVYTMTPDAFPYLPKKGSLELDVFPALSLRGQLYGCKYPGCLWRSIESQKDIEEASEQVSSLGVREGPGAPETASWYRLGREPQL
jgi:NDP-sugar pyrophosphorylase family protein